MTIKHVSLLHTNNKKVLLVKERGRDTWQAPGGEKEEGETDSEALIRECFEELSVKIDPSSIKIFTTFKGKSNGENPNIDIEINIYTAEFKDKIQPGSEIDTAQYFSYDKLIKLPGISIQFFDQLKSDGIIN